MSAKSNKSSKDERSSFYKALRYFIYFISLFLVIKCAG